MFDDIKRHFDSEYPREGCGIISIVKGKKQWFPCTNRAKEDEDFVIDSTEFIRIYKSSDIIGIVHSHPDASNEPSPSDIANCNALGIPYYIFSYPSMELNIVQPGKVFKPLIGREYEFGSTDCFEACKDYLKEYHNIEIKPRQAFEDDWWEKDLDYFTDEMFSEYGFEPVDLQNIKVGDILTFTMGSKVPNHCGVYVGGNAFFHHAVNRLSCRDFLDTVWIKALTGAYRYVT